MSSARQRKWIVRDDAGRVSGPFSTRALLQKISEGRVGEEYQVARYPGGDWQAISKNPEFYDRLLETLEREAERDSSGKNSHPAAKEEDRTQAGRVYREGQEDNVTPRTSALPEDDEVVEEREVVSRMVDGAQRAEDSNVLDLEDKSQLVKVYQFKRFWKPLAVLGLLLVSATVFLMWPSTPKGRIHLRAPSKSGGAMSDQKFRKELIRAKRAYFRDTFRGYWEAQNRLITLVASRSKSLPARSLLCATYRELWPYSFQGRKDLGVFSEMVMATRKMDPSGKHGVICESSFAVSQGEFQKAQNLIEAALPLNVREPMFYEMRAAVWEHQKKYSLAIDYLRTIQNIEPRWIKPYRLQAYYLAKTKRFSEAFQVLQVLLKKALLTRSAILKSVCFTTSSWTKKTRRFSISSLVCREVSSSLPLLRSGATKPSPKFI